MLVVDKCLLNGPVLDFDRVLASYYKVFLLQSLQKSDICWNVDVLGFIYIS